MADFAANLAVAVSAALVPTVALVLGGQSLLDRHERKTAAYQQRLELARFVREKQYEALLEAYSLYGQLVGLYRRINWGVEHGRPRPEPPWLRDAELKRQLADEAIVLEAKAEAVIIRIGSEFATAASVEMLESLLGNVRQSVQLWRESIASGTHIPFYGSESRPYLRFKLSFSDLCSYLAGEALAPTEPTGAQQKHARQLLHGLTSNKYETSEAMDSFLRASLET